ncbi:MAG: hypothetical protein WDN45_10480 [Caulobacteraceae bacterium]
MLLTNGVSIETKRAVPRLERRLAVPDSRAHPRRAVIVGLI